MSEVLTDAIRFRVEKVVSAWISKKRELVVLQVGVVDSNIMSSSPQESWERYIDYRDATVEDLTAHKIHVKI